VLYSAVHCRQLCRHVKRDAREQLRGLRKTHVSLSALYCVA
jgi:hypothetical protein